jgi:hypothetical protein
MDDEAAETPTQLPAIAEAPSAADERISFEKAGELLIGRYHNAHSVCVGLDIAIRGAMVRLYAGDRPVSPSFYAGHLRVAAAVDGRVELLPTRAINATYVWTLLCEDVLKLADAVDATSKPDAASESVPPRTRRGPQVKFAWDLLMGEVVRMQYVGDLLQIRNSRMCC